MNLEVDVIVLSQEINKLRDLYLKVVSESSKEYVFKCKGATCDWIRSINSDLLYCEELLGTLILVIEKFCKNAENGLLETDETLSNLFKAVMG